MASSLGNPAETVWAGLVAGDPGPTVALFDALMDADFAFAAGGLLRDLAERLGDADEVISDERERIQFVSAVQQALLHCLDNDEEAVDALMREANSGEEA